ncbi:MAG: DNRLRE domain-containing protein [Cytophagales bacterium]|nr:DNRLRE domain-containing protein [Cytophagales bacterium]
MKPENALTRFLGALILVTVTVYSGTLKAQTTVTLYPDIDAGVIQALAYPDKVNNNYGNYTVNRAWTWTWSGQEYYWCSFIKFDLSSIPAGATIMSAELTLYGTGHDPLTSSNASYLERVTSGWTEMGVTWATQPMVTTTGRISLAQSTSSTQNYTMDVTSFVQGWVNGDYTNYGLRFKLQTESHYASMEFASSDHTDLNKHPRLVITYMTTSSDYDKNYVKKYHPNVEESSVVNIKASSKSVSRKSKNYVDGFGRLIQEIGIEASPAGKDIVRPGGGFDAMGRPERDYLPFAMTTANGGQYVTGATSASNWTAHYGSTEDDYAFSETLYEANPLGRPIKQGAPGSAWEVTDGTAIEYSYSSNASNEVILWTIDASGNVKTGSQAYYTANVLAKNKIIDPDENIIITYTNKSGQTILTKVQASTSPTETSHAGWACTYNVYDDYGRLRRTLTPELVDGIYGSVTSNYTISSTIMDNLAFQREYDHRDRMIKDKVPATGWNYYVYDGRDRLVLSQNAKQRNADEWTLTKYDKINRPVMKGIYSDTRDLASMQSFVDTYVGVSLLYYEERGAAMHEYTNNAFAVLLSSDDYLEVIYYDDYDFDYAENNGFTAKLGYSSTDKSDAVAGKVTGKKVRKLGDGVTGWLSSVIYYDKDGQVIQVKGENHLGGYDLVTTEYNFVGDPTKTEHVHNTTSATVTETEEFTYDHMGRMLTHTHKIGSQPAVTLADLDYDELGRLVTENIGNSIESMDYAYNIRGWTTEIYTRTPEIFRMDIKYNSGITTGVPVRYGGNIAEVQWGLNFASMQFGYHYDPMNRLIKATDGMGIYGVSGNDNGNIGYDLNGNIESLKREKGDILIDDLNYTYTSGRLTKVEDATSNTNGFNNGNTSGDDYAYYDNGLLKYDKNKAINADIVYNEVNLPEKIIFSNNYKIKFMYGADGTKMQMILENNSGTPITTIDYVGNMIYANGMLEQLLTAGGRVLDPTTVGPDYEYFITDHLGSVRAVVDELGSVKQTRDYYPFGMEMSASLTASPKNSYGYQGKEWIEEQGLEWQDFHARMYDPAIGRFLAVDPAGQFHSPYTGMGNNPVMMVDPDGEFVFSALLPGVGTVIDVALWGAVVGAGSSAAVYATTTAVSGNQWDWGQFGNSVALGTVSGAIGGGIGGAFTNSAFAQTAGFSLLNNTASTVAGTAIMGGDITGGTIIGGIAGGLVGTGLPQFTGVKGGALANVGAELGYEAVRGGITGAVTGGVSAAVDGRGIGEGIKQGALYGAVGGATMANLKIAALGHTVKLDQEELDLIYKELGTDYFSASSKYPDPVFRKGWFFSRGITIGRNVSHHLISDNDTFSGVKNGGLAYNYGGMAHEMMHYRQLSQVGIGRFYGKLFIQYLRYGYKNSPYEYSAYNFGSHIFRKIFGRVLDQQYRSK